MSVQTEIERKYLIVLPAESLLAALPHSDIAQTYLIARSGETDRVRKRVTGEHAVYTRTRKTRLSPLSAREDESVITENEYAALLASADPERSTIYKTRYLLKKGALTFEIDVYPFWKRQAVMEIELESESSPFELPEEIRVLREVTGNKAYSNAAIAKQIPAEDP